MTESSINCQHNHLITLDSILYALFRDHKPSDSYVNNNNNKKYIYIAEAVVVFCFQNKYC